MREGGFMREGEIFPPAQTPCRYVRARTDLASRPKTRKRPRSFTSFTPA